MTLTPLLMAQDVFDSKAIYGGNLSLSQFLAVVVLLAVLAWMGWSYLERSNLNQAIATLQIEISDAEAQLEQLKAESLDAVIVAQQTVEQVEASAILWSEMIAHLEQITPVNVFYRSYSASVDGRMALSVLTDSYDSAADLLSIFEEDTSFGNAFAASLTQGSTDSGIGVVSFGLTFAVTP